MKYEIQTKTANFTNIQSSLQADDYNTDTYPDLANNIGQDKAIHAPKVMF